jgi:hypothetical protein
LVLSVEMKTVNVFKEYFYLSNSSLLVDSALILNYKEPTDPLLNFIHFKFCTALMEWKFIADQKWQDILNSVNSNTIIKSTGKNSVILLLTPYIQECNATSVFPPSKSDCVILKAYKATVSMMHIYHISYYKN